MIWKEALSNSREPHHLREAIVLAGEHCFSTLFCIRLNIKAQELIDQSVDALRIEYFEEIIEDHRDRVLKYQEEESLRVKLKKVPRDKFERASLRYPEQDIPSNYLRLTQLADEMNLEQIILKELTIKAINACNGSRSKACVVLGIHPRTLRNRLKSWAQ